jgi:hypothetical protein
METQYSSISHFCLVMPLSVVSPTMGVAIKISALTLRMEYRLRGMQKHSAVIDIA